MGTFPKQCQTETCGVKCCYAANDAEQMLDKQDVAVAETQLFFEEGGHVGLLTIDSPIGQAFCHIRGCWTSISSVAAR